MWALLHTSPTPCMRKTKQNTPLPTSSPPPPTHLGHVGEQRNLHVAQATPGARGPEQGREEAYERHVREGVCVCVWGGGGGRGGGVN